MKVAVLRAARTVVLSGVASVALGFGTVAAEESAAQPPLGQTQAAAKAAYANKLICTKEPVPGSNIKKKVCRTQAQIDQERAASQSMMNDLNKYQGRTYDGS